MNSAAFNHPCLVCGRPTSQWCSRCRAAFYCSPEHLQGDWPHHRERCRPSALYGSNMIATPPSAELDYITISAILLLANEGASILYHTSCALILSVPDRPKIITVKSRPPHRPSDGLCPVPLLQLFFDVPPDSIVLTQNQSGELLRFPLHVFYSPTALKRRTPISRSIYHITSGAAPKPWCGNVVALKSVAGSNDLPALSAYFLSCQ
ncbi:hypothetical protein B0H13DRAFT_2236700 [Mycena leptocephala]|nr:hypothetical protein B0H13DRAFT_2236700 [Mycena leptocephala]